MFRAASGLLACVSLAPLVAGAASKCGPAMVQLVVLDQGGNALSGLKPGDFKVKIKGQTASVRAVDFGLFPHSTLLLISRTNSMGESIKMEMARQLASAITNGAPGPVMNGTFAGDVSGIADARTQPVNAGVQVGPDNHNSLYDAVFAGMATMNMHRGDAVVVITDSTDSGSKTTSSELQQRFTNSGARFFVVALPPATGSGAMQALAALADATGGGVLVPLRLDDTSKGVVITPAQLDGAAETIGRAYMQYNNIYQLETDLDGQDRPMPLRVEADRHKVGGGKIVAPAMLAPCNAIAQ
jgi:hypothetical protein